MRTPTFIIATIFAALLGLAYIGCEHVYGQEPIADAVVSSDYIELSPSGGIDTERLQIAADQFLDIRLTAGEFNTGEVFFRSGTTLRGAGKWATRLVSTRVAGERCVINIQNKERILIRDLSVSGGAESFEYGQGGPFAVMASNGNGTNNKSNRVTLDNCRFHHCSGAMMSIYGGIERWHVKDCDFEYSGRGCLNSNSMRNTTIQGCYFGPSGDDMVMIGGRSYNVTITGCVFDQASSIDSTGAAGLKIHAKGITVTGNTFWGCNTAMMIQQAPGYGWSNGYKNLGGGSKDIVVSGNVIGSIGNVKINAEHKGFTGGIRLQSVDGLVLDGNTIVAIEAVKKWDHEGLGDYEERLEATGNPRTVLRMDYCRNIRSSDNYFCGTRVQVGASEFRSRNDQYDILGEYAIAAVWKGDSKIDVADAQISDNIDEDHVLLVDNNGELDQDIQYDSQTRRRLGYLVSTVPLGGTTLVLESTHAQFRGLEVKRLAGERLRLVDYEGNSENVTLTEDAFKNQTTLKIAATTGTYQAKESWLEWPDDEEPPTPVQGITPNPSTWNAPPAAISSTSIAMQANVATDSDGAEVEYAFINTATGVIEYQDSVNHLAENLEPGTEYTFLLHVREKGDSANNTQFSVPATATTDSE